MAKNTKGKKGKKNSYADRITQLARDLGAIERGRKNPDSRVSAAYEEGKKPKEQTKKKPLF